MSSGERGCLAALLILVSVITLLGSGCGLLVAIHDASAPTAGYLCCAIGLALTILLWAWVIRMLRRRNKDPLKEAR